MLTIVEFGKKECRVGGWATHRTLIVLKMFFITDLGGVLANRLHGSIMAVNSMEFNGVRLAPNIQFGLAGDPAEIRPARTEYQAGLM